jgi:acyl-CoA reductase-like NAD-dependent aldehyde dehydrogenase
VCLNIETAAAAAAAAKRFDFITADEDGPVSYAVQLKHVRVDMAVIQGKTASASHFAAAAAAATKRLIGD